MPDVDLDIRIEAGFLAVIESTSEAVKQPERLLTDEKSPSSWGSVHRIQGWSHVCGDGRLRP